MKRKEKDIVSIIKEVWGVLGSMKLFCVVSLMISAWFFALILIYPKIMQLISEMNEDVLIKWFLSSNGIETAPIKGWLFVLFILMVVLSANLIVCLINDVGILVRIVKTKAEAKIFMGRLGILLMHFSYILIILGHAGASFLGFKQSFNVKEGMSYSYHSIPFDVHVNKLNKDFDINTGQKTIRSADVALNNGGFDDREITVAMKKTALAGKYHISLNEKSAIEKKIKAQPSGGKKQKVATLRVAWNPGMPLFYIGAALFFPGLVLRMFFRNH